jgi:nucleotide-binding universal stress UspA family protein
VTAPAGPVVVGVDGSTGSRDAVRWAAGYARLTGAELTAVASWRWPNYVTRIPPGVDLEADTRRTLHEVVADAALLVVGARGRAAYPGMLPGSVSPALPNAGPQRTIMHNAGTLTRHARHDSVASSGGAPDR